jgi:hypothetical protein
MRSQGARCLVWLCAALSASCESGSLITAGDGGPCDGGDCLDGDPFDADVDPCDTIVCPAGQSCAGGRCETSDRCADTSCSNPGEVCDPRDGMCHAGGADDDGDGTTIAEGDCDDGDAATFPGAAETCDGVDQDCDRAVDDGFPDADDDGFDTCGFGNTAQADCDDADRRVYPGRPEQCNGDDEDCDGELDEGIATRPCEGACGAGEERCEGGEWACSAPEVGECVPGATGACDTSCGTRGTTICEDTCGWSSTCTAPAETCDGNDDDCDGQCDEGCRHGVHRLYHPTDYDHFYTADEAEGTCCGYYVESTSYFYLSTTQVPGTVPLYQCYLAAWTDHMLSVSSDCEGSGTPPSGIVGYIATAAACGAVPLYRLFDPAGLDHIFTTSDAEREALLAGGCSNEGVTGYVWTTP